MPRLLAPASIDAAPEAARASLIAATARLGETPNVLLVAATSPAAIEGLAAFSAAIAKGALDAATGERIALAIAKVNGSAYCDAAHTHLAQAVGLSEEEIAMNRDGGSTDPKADAAVRFAKLVATARGALKDSDLNDARKGGVTEAELVEVVAHVALNTFTNYLNVVFETENDVPVASEAVQAA